MQSKFPSREGEVPQLSITRSENVPFNLDGDNGNKSQVYEKPWHPLLIIFLLSQAVVRPGLCSKQGS